MLSLISDEGKKDIVNLLGIKAIFDLRHTEERETNPEPVIDGVKSFRAEVNDVKVDWRSVSSGLPDICGWSCDGLVSGHCR